MQHARAARRRSAARRGGRCRAPRPPPRRRRARPPRRRRTAVNIPIEFEPPPTQAITRCGRRPARSSTCARASSPITRWRSRTSAGIGRRADARADDVVGGRDVRHPVADRRRDRLLERPRAGLDRLDRRAEQPHPLDVGLLAAHVLGAHVDDALEVEQRARRRRGHAVLAGAGLGDDPPLAHPLGQQRLAERVVDLVGAGVVEVLALEVDRVAGGLAQPRGAVERRGPADVVAQQARRARRGRPGPRGRRPTPPRARPAPASASRGRTGPRRGRSGARPRSSRTRRARAAASRDRGGECLELARGPCARAQLDPAGHVDRERPHDARSPRRRFGRQPAAEDHGTGPRWAAGELPGERLARCRRGSPGT